MSTEEVKKEGQETEKKLSRIYEVGYHLLPIIPEEDVAGIVTTIKDSIDKVGGQVASEDFPKMLELAYSMRKSISAKYQNFDSAYFGWVKFEGMADSVEVLKKDLDSNQNILRFIITNTVRENTMSSSKTFALKEKEKESRQISSSSRHTKTEIEEKAPISEEELDKTIEELVVE